MAVNIELSNNEVRAIWAALLTVNKIDRIFKDGKTPAATKKILKGFLVSNTVPYEFITQKPAMKNELFKELAQDFFEFAKEGLKDRDYLEQFKK